MTANPIASMTSDALAIAEASADELRVTIEHLHGRLAIARAEAESHLERIDAVERDAAVKASQRDTFERALAHEREAGKGLVAQVDTLRAAAEENRGALVDVADSLHVNTLGVSSTDVATRCGVAIAKLRFELDAIRDLVAPGNPQGTVVDAVRAMATGLIESIGARDAAEQARDMARDSRDAAIARAEAAERTLSGLYDDSKAELAKLRAELAEMTATRDRLLAREHEDGRLHAQLRAELAELRARPVLTEDLLRGALDAHGYAGLTRKLFAHLGPVTLPLAELRARPVLTVEAFTEAYIKTKHGGKAWPGEEADRRGLTAQFRATFAALGPVALPSPDRAEELCRAYHDRMSIDGKPPAPAWNEFSAEARVTRVTAMRLGLAALAKLSPAPAPTFDAAFLRRVMVATKHGPNGKGGPGPCDVACVKCEAERMVKAAPAREVAPTRVLVHADGGACHGSRVVDGRCVGCGIAPDMQSTSLWLDADARPVQCEPAKVVAPALVAVSDEELVAAFAQAHLECPCDESGEEWAKYPPDCCDLAGIRAVRAKLGAAEVTEERLAAALAISIPPANGQRAKTCLELARDAIAYLRATAAKGG